MDRPTRQKSNKETVALNDSSDQMDLTDIYRTFHLKATEGAPGWLIWLSIQLWLRSDLAVRGFVPRVGLCADSSEPGA